jgi:hypothetical protein
VEVPFSPQGYNGDVCAKITENPAGFLCDHPNQSDRFPTRIKNASAALYDLGRLGCYRIHHHRATGIVGMVRLA